MKHSWFNSVFPIAAIFSFRMLGLFMLIPVFTVFAAKLQGATPVLMGLALGSYGLTQGILQIPFGFLSDRFGRKPILTLGLVLFALGSLVGALSHSIYTMILARTLQGTGAIGSVLIALLADLTPDGQRTKAMAVIGMTIGLSFSLAMILSPALTNHYGLAGIFYLTVLLALLGLALLHLVIPTPQKERFHVDSEVKLSLFKIVLSNKHLQRLNAGIFFQHFILTATFFAIPQLLQQQIQQGHLHESWHFYLPLMFFSFLAMVPFIVLAEKKGLMKTIFSLTVLTTGLCQLLLVFTKHNWPIFCLVMFLYFVAFNILEASLPSLVSKQAGPTSKGTAMGVYSSSQFLGIFVGGLAAGLLFQLVGYSGIFLTNALLGLLWWLLSLSMQPQVYLTTLILSYPQQDGQAENCLEQLKALPGVKDALLAPEEAVIYLRVEKASYQEGSAEKIISHA